MSKNEHERVSRHISEASRALNKIAIDFRIPTPGLCTPAITKSEDEPKISTPQTNHLVSSFKELKEESTSSFILRKESLKAETEIDPIVDSEDIAIGRTFDNLDDAAEEFQRYALRCGFNICKGNSKKDVYQEYACSARGKVRMRKISEQDKRRNRKSIKKMCKCHIILRMKGNKWTITTRKLQHTHELLTSEEIKRTAKNRFIPDPIKQRALALYNAGEAPAKIQYQLETELGDKCTWSMKDLYNMLYRHKDSSNDESLNSPSQS